MNDVLPIEEEVIVTKAANTPNPVNAAGAQTGRVVATGLPNVPAAPSSAAIASRLSGASAPTPIPTSTATNAVPIKRPTVVFEALNDEVQIPVRATEGAAGFDLLAPKKLKLKPGRLYAVELGFKAAIPPGYVGIFKERSGLGKKGVEVRAGVIDSDYRGEWIVVLTSPIEEVIIEKGKGVAQVVFQKMEVLDWEAGVMDETERGEGGFGHTDNK